MMCTVHREEEGGWWPRWALHLDAILREAGFVHSWLIVCGQVLEREAGKDDMLSLFPDGRKVVFTSNDLPI